MYIVRSHTHNIRYLSRLAIKEDASCITHPLLVKPVELDLVLDEQTFLVVEQLPVLGAQTLKQPRSHSQTQ